MKGHRDYIDKVEYNGVVIVGDEKEVIIPRLKLEHDLTLVQIARILHENRVEEDSPPPSRQYIQQVLAKQGISGKRNLDKLKDLDYLKSKPDTMIAQELNVAVSRVAAARSKKNLKIRRPKPVSLQNRQLFLASYLFGNGYLPGPKFADYIGDLFETLPPDKNAAMRKFYVFGAKDESSKARVVRTHARRVLLARNQDKPKKLVKEGFLAKA